MRSEILYRVGLMVGIVSGILLLLVTGMFAQWDYKRSRYLFGGLSRTRRLVLVPPSQDLQ